MFPRKSGGRYLCSEKILAWKGCQMIAIEIYIALFLVFIIYCVYKEFTRRRQMSPAEWVKEDRGDIDENISYQDLSRGMDGGR
jgi:hypothetical protein